MQSDTAFVEQSHAGVKRKADKLVEEATQQIDLKRIAAVEEAQTIHDENTKSIQEYLETRSGILPKVLDSQAKLIGALNEVKRSLEKDISPKLKLLDKMTDINKYATQLEAELRSSI